MRFLLISSSDMFSTYGGGQVYFKNFVDTLLSKDIQFELACPGEQKEEYYKNKKIHYFDSSGTEEFIRNLLITLKPDLIHAHGFKSVFSKIGDELGIPVVITAHHGGILCPAGTLLNHKDEICKVKASHDSCMPCVLKNIRGGTYAYSFLNMLNPQQGLKISNWIKKLGFVPYFSPVMGVSGSIQKKAKEWEDIINFSSLMIAPSDAIAEAMMFNGYPKDKIKVIPHGIPLPKLSRETKESSNTSPMKLFYLGRINRVKGIHILCKAFAQISQEFELHIFGNAVTKEEKRYLSSLRKQYSTDHRILWRGGVTSDLVSETIAKMDLMIHPTICMEIYGLNIAETLALGIPVIATRCGGAEMQIIDGENGYLVEPNDADALKKGIEKFLNAPEKLNVNASSVISIEEHVNKLIEGYASLIN